MGRAGSVKTTAGDAHNSLIQDETYEFDAIGNLTRRSDHVMQLDEDFQYDTLNRLTQARVSNAGASTYQLAGLTTVNLTYDGIGNILSKSDVNNGATYQYGTGNAGDGINNAGPHAVTSVGGAGFNFAYDANGNQIIGRDDASITYSSFNKPLSIDKGSNQVFMAYSPSRGLLQQEEVTNGKYSKTTYITNVYEESVQDHQTHAKHHLKIAGRTVAVVSFKKQSASSYTFDKTHYLHRDHLDSVTVITDHTGKVVERNHFDAFGKRRTAVADNLPVRAAGLLPITNRGYTGHKMLDGVDLIHMGGRMYDPVLGRFTSADPHIQYPLDSQNFNRYSYVQNNPLSLTDPSGYFIKNLLKKLKKLIKRLKKLLKKIGKIVVKAVKLNIVTPIRKTVKFVKKYWKPILAVAAMVVAPYAVAAMQLGSVAAATAAIAANGVAATIGVGGAIAAGAIGGGLSGLITTGSLKGMLNGAITGAIFAGIGQGFSGLSESSSLVKSTAALGNTGKTIVTSYTAAGHVARVVAHGVAGGVSSVLNGGKFKAGFTAAALGKSFSIGSGNFVNLSTIEGSATKAFAAGVVGGVGAKLTGGDFEQGFVTSAAGQIFNDAFTSREQVVKAAMASEGSNDWAYGNSKPPLAEETNKCTLFVHDTLNDSGEYLPLQDNGYSKYLPFVGTADTPYNARQWANGDVPGYFPVDDPIPGDIAVYKANYRDATGHAGIVGYNDSGQLGVYNAGYYQVNWTPFRRFFTSGSGELMSPEFMRRGH